MLLPAKEADATSCWIGRIGGESQRIAGVFLSNAGGQWAGFCRGASSFAGARKLFSDVAAERDGDAGYSGFRNGEGASKLCLRDSARQAPVDGRRRTDSE
jgi:hypothetical protein